MLTVTSKFHVYLTTYVFLSLDYLTSIQFLKSLKILQSHKKCCISLCPVCKHKYVDFIFLIIYEADGFSLESFYF